MYYTNKTLGRKLAQVSLQITYQFLWNTHYYSDESYLFRFFSKKKPLLMKKFFFSEFQENMKILRQLLNNQRKQIARRTE